MRGKAKSERTPRIRREQSAAAIGEIFDVDEKTVRRWVGDGCPHRRDGAKKLWLNDGEVRAWLESEGRTARPGRPPEAKPDTPEDLGGDKDYWLARKYRNQCLEDEKRLVDRDESDRAWTTRVVTAKNKTRGIGAEIAPQLVGLEAAEIQTRIEQRIDQIWRELAAGD